MAMPPTLVRTTYLEITDPARIVPASRCPEHAMLLRAVLPSPELNRFLYSAVGGDWYWRDRLLWSWADWMACLDRPGYETWYATARGTPAAFFELDATKPPSVEIAIFGVLPAFQSLGFGGWLLESALRRGFDLGRRVWLHTCTLDHPAALANYWARGLTSFREEESTVALPSEPPGPWPGALREPIGVRQPAR